MDTQTSHLLAVVFGVLASVFLVLAVAVYQGYITSAEVGLLTYGELGTLAFVFLAGAIGISYLEK